MKDFFYFFLNNSRLTFVITLAILILGGVSLKKLRRETRPPVDFARVIIGTSLPGASSEEIEEQITFKIEEQMRLVDGLLDTRSVSASGISHINSRIDFDNQNTKEIVDEIQRAISRVKNLPSDILDLPFLKHIKAKNIPLFKIIISGSNENRQRDKISFQIKTLVESNPGVAEAILAGYMPREFKIILNQKELIQHHISLEEVIRAVSSHTKNFSTGRIKSSKSVKQVKFLGKIKHAFELEDIVIRSNFSGQKILIKDVGHVLDDKEEPKGLARFNGQPVTYLLISKKEKTDSIHLSNDVEKLLKNFNLPKGYDITIYDNESARTKTQLNIVSNNALVGLLLVLAILLTLLPIWSGLLSALSLPISILGTVALCASFGITFNTITMLAFIICIGMLVDNSVVVSENYSRLRHDNIPNLESALQSVLQLYKPITATILTTIASFLPMLVVKGIMGQFIKWIPIVVCIALFVSLIDAFLLLPSRLKWTIQKINPKSSPIQSYFKKLSTLFEKSILFCLHHRYLTFFSLIALVLFSASINFWGNKFILFPKDDVRAYSISYDIETGSSIEYTDEKSQKLISDITKTVGTPEIEGILSHSGSSHSGLFSRRNSHSGDHSGIMILILKENSIYRKKPNILLKKLRAIDTSNFKFIEFDPIGAGPPTGKPLHILFTSHSRESLKAISNQFQKEIKKIPGIVNVENDIPPAGPEYHLYPKKEVLAKLNISNHSLGQVLKSSLEGAIAGEMIENGESFYVRVYYDSSIRSDINKLKETKILTPNKELISLKNILTIKEIKQGSPLRKRFDFQPSLEVTANVNPSITNSEIATNKANKLLTKMIKKFPSVSFKFLGEKRHTKESLDSLFQAMILALFGIFAILLLLFKGFLVSGLALSSIFLGLIGLSISFALHERPLSFLALIGAVGLAGVTINSSIILISFIENLRKKYPHQDLMKTLSIASKYRFKPIIITTCTTVFGLLPSAYGIGGHDSALIPMTLAFTWGLASGSILTLFWIPCGYAIIEDLKKLFQFPFLRKKKSTQNSK